MHRRSVTTDGRTADTADRERVLNAALPVALLASGNVSDIRVKQNIAGTHSPA